MSAFENSRFHTEEQVMMNLLVEIDRNPHLTQRGHAGELGIALGIINKYLKYCISRGWVRVSQVSPRRLAYFLTPEGMQEKSRMVAGYISRSLTFFRDARCQCEEIYNHLMEKECRTVALTGQGDLADIAALIGRNMGFYTEVIDCGNDDYLDVDYYRFDAVLITEQIKAQEVYDHLLQIVSHHKIHCLPLSMISRFTHISTGVGS